MTLTDRSGVVFALWSLPLTLGAHHSTQAVYDVGTVTEIEEAVTRVLWQNRHVRFTIRAKNDRGAEEVWNVETQSVSILRRMQIPSDVLNDGRSF